MPLDSAEATRASAPVEPAGDWPIVSEGALETWFSYSAATVVVGLRGTLEGPSVLLLVATLDLALAHRPARLVVDAQEVTGCSARALAIFAESGEQAARAGTSFSLVGLAPVHQRLIRRCWPRLERLGGLHDAMGPALQTPGGRDGSPNGGDAAAEVAQLRRALSLRGTLERAIGVVMAGNLCSPSVAFGRLADAADRAGLSVNKVAAAVLTHARAG